MRRQANSLACRGRGLEKAIGRLEDRTGMRLFDRNSRAIKLTDQDELFWMRQLRCSRHWDGLQDPLRQRMSGGRLRVSTDGALGPYLLIPILPDFLADNPQVKVDLFVRDRIDNLLSEGVDAAIGSESPNPTISTSSSC